MDGMCFLLLYFMISYLDFQTQERPDAHKKKQKKEKEKKVQKEKSFAPTSTVPPAPLSRVSLISLI